MKTEYAARKPGTRQSPIDIRNPAGSAKSSRSASTTSRPRSRSPTTANTIRADYAPGSHIRRAARATNWCSSTSTRLRRAHQRPRLRHGGAPWYKNACAASRRGRRAAYRRRRAEDHPDHLNAMPGPSRPPASDLTTINAADLLPGRPDLLQLHGFAHHAALHREGVQWLVMKNRRRSCATRSSHFTALYPMNACPLQAQNDCLIKVGRQGAKLAKLSQRGSVS